MPAFNYIEVNLLITLILCFRQVGGMSCVRNSQLTHSGVTSNVTRLPSSYMWGRCVASSSTGRLTSIPRQGIRLGCVLVTVWERTFTLSSRRLSGFLKQQSFTVKLRVLHSLAQFYRSLVLWDIYRSLSLDLILIGKNFMVT